MKVAVLGSGGREHALVWKLCQHHRPEDIYFLPGNPGFKQVYPLDVSDFQALEAFCRKENIELLIVGPEAPLVEGITDYFQDKPLKVFGPDKAAAQLESSKIWAKRFMKKHKVATAAFEAYQSPDEAKNMIASFNGNLVIKYDGLAGGKGVYVCKSMKDANAALADLKKKHGPHFPFLVEQILEGQEISIIGITDGKSIKLLTPSQDHKRAFDGDEGPNTGGMGAFCPVPFYDKVTQEAIDRDIIQPTLQGIKAEGMNYKGFIYFGIMLTKRGPKLLEYNTRFGDPEAEVVLPKLKTDLLELIQAAMDERLDEVAIEEHPGAFVDVVLTSGGYPGSYPVGKPITGLNQLSDETWVFHSGTKMENGKLVTAGGRVLNIVCQGNNLEEAIAKVYTECAKVSFEGMEYRKDIAQKGLPVAV